jgi:hypothetical protein
MRPQGKLLVCTAAVWLISSVMGWGQDPDSPVFDEQLEVPWATPDDGEPVPASVGAPLSVFVPALTPGFQFSASFLLLKPGADNLGWSTLTTFLPVQSPQWDVQNLNPAYQPGFSVGAQYVVPNSGKDIQTNWDHLRTSDSSFVPVSNLSTQWITPFNQTGPSTNEQYNEVGLYYFKSAAAKVDFAYDMVNVDAGQTVNCGPNTQIRLFAGVSWVRLQEQLVSTFYNDPTAPDPAPPSTATRDPFLRYITLNNTTSYSGAGPRLGLTATQNVSHGFTFVGQLSGAVLAGRMQPAQYTFQGVFDNRTDSEQISSRAVTQVVYATDARLGLGYNRLMANSCSFSFESGFRAALFLNPFATYETSTNVLPLSIGSLSTNSMRHTPSNFTLNGWYASVSVRW